MVKKLILVILSVVLMFSLAMGLTACNKGNEGTGKVPTSQSDNGSNSSNNGGDAEDLTPSKCLEYKLSDDGLSYRSCYSKHI